MTISGGYKAREWNLSGLTGISDKTLEMHFKLYAGYVTETNRLTDQLAAMSSDGQVDHEEMPAYSELTRRLGFEYNGMVLHELYFDNLVRGAAGEPGKKSIFARAAAESFGSFDIWKTAFVSVGKMRGVGWAICFQDPHTGRLSNHWVTLHEVGNVAGYTPVLVMDVWEHAFLLDYTPAQRPKYIEAFLANTDWDVLDQRLSSVGMRAAG
ncbi:MAG TPA: Fe-Mn family superoxide dismutase [Candidatus Bathyarchaeia archaeon]|nr:Fe-Mn family superoxide dismutase [Candidatus Bathyarchaeia archaeon]